MALTSDWKLVLCQSTLWVLAISVLLVNAGPGFQQGYKKQSRDLFPQMRFYLKGNTVWVPGKCTVARKHTCGERVDWSYFFPEATSDPFKEQ